MAEVEIIIGSKSDLPLVEESGMLEVFQHLKISYNLSIISAHRHPDILQDFLRHTKASIIIAAAGMSAALPGVIAAEVGDFRIVIGVPLPSAEFPNAFDALMSMIRLPAGMPIAVPGIGKTGLKNAAFLACQIISLADEETDGNLTRYLAQMKTEPEINARSYEFIGEQDECDNS